jgi:hypothetical protein
MRSDDQGSQAGSDTSAPPYPSLASMGGRGTGSRDGGGEMQTGNAGRPRDNRGGDERGDGFRAGRVYEGAEDDNVEFYSGGFGRGEGGMLAGSERFAASQQYDPHPPPSMEQHYASSNGYYLPSSAEHHYNQHQYHRRGAEHDLLPVSKAERQGDSDRRHEEPQASFAGGPWPGRDAAGRY